jgi:predicted TIM-barrel fold metal-dependent hydrolase
MRCDRIADRVDVIDPFTIDSFAALPSMKDKIALEEHFAIDLTIGDSQVYARPEMWTQLKQNLLDFEHQRLEQMDEWGTALSILSLNSPAVQSIPDPQTAVQVAKRANDILAEQIQRHPTRFGGFAALPMQDPDAAAHELERCVTQLGFHGFLVNGFLPGRR